MTFVDSIMAYIDKFRFWEIVYEYKQGLHFRKGTVIKRKIRWDDEVRKKGLNRMIEEENSAMEANGGLWRYLVPFSRPEVPDGFRRSFLTGKLKYVHRRDRARGRETHPGSSGSKQLDFLGMALDEDRVMEENGGAWRYLLPFFRPSVPEGYRRSVITGRLEHEGRYSKILRPGIYGYVPFIDDIIAEDVKERVMDLQNVSVPTSDAGDESKVMSVSCAIRYEIQDYYKALTKVHDYENTLQDYTIAELAKHIRGGSYEEWKEKRFIKGIESNILRELRKTATRKWGVKIHDFYITDHIHSDVKRLLHEGLEDASGAEFDEE